MPDEATQIPERAMPILDELVERCATALHEGCPECGGAGVVMQDTGVPGQDERLGCETFEHARHAAHLVLSTAVMAQAEATSLEIPGEWDPVLGIYTGGAWTWAGPIYAGASDSMKWREWPDQDHREGPFELRVSQDVIRRLYASGYALVKVVDR